ncbi:MAG: hypothetical protein J7483_10960 [Novosphingobium sp.]|nr:hypothetical protein [Novosphingobium sp.]
MNIKLMKHFVHQNEPLIADVPAHIIHEGQAASMSRSDGKNEAVEIKKHEGRIEISVKPLEEFDAQFLIKKLKEIAEQLAGSISKTMLEAVSQGAESVGNVYDAKGKPFSRQMLLDVLKMMSHSFDEDGNWETPRMVVGPEMMKKVQESYEQATASERNEYDRKLAEIIRDKKAEYDSEQAGRILAG